MDSREPSGPISEQKAMTCEFTDHMATYHQSHPSLTPGPEGPQGPPRHGRRPTRRAIRVIVWSK